MLKKVTALLLAMIMLLSMAPMALAEEPMEITIATWFMDDSFNNGGDLVYEIIQDKFNIKIIPMSMTWGDYREKTSTWLATGDTPDIFVTDGLSGDPAMYNTVKSWVNDGLIHALPEDMSAYPNLAARFEDPVVQNTMIDGKYWAIPRYKGDSEGPAWAANHGAYYRKDWAKNLGFDSIDTLDELMAFLRAVRDGDPTGTGATDIVPMGTSMYAYYVTNFMWATFEHRFWGQWLYEDGELYRAFEAPHSYDAALFIRNMYNEGLIDPDIVVNEGTEAGYDSFAAGKTAVLCGQLFGMDALLWDKFTANNPDVALEDAVGYLSFMPNIYDGKSYCFDYNVNFWAETYIAAGVSDEKFEKIMQFLDFTSSDEWMNYFIYGIEGVDYKVENGEVVFLTEDGKRPDVLAKYPVLNGINELTLLFEGRKFAPLTTNYPYVAQMFDDHFVESESRERIPTTSLTFLVTTEEDEFYVDNSTMLLNLFCYGGSTGDPEAEWDAMIQQLKDEGLEEVVAAKVEAVRELGRME